MHLTIDANGRIDVESMEVALVVYNVSFHHEQHQRWEHLRIKLVMDLVCILRRTCGIVRLEPDHENLLIRLGIITSVHSNQI